MPDVNWNKYRGKDYEWENDWDERNDQAQYCSVPYQDRKQSIVEQFIKPYMNNSSKVLEIAPGHGRRTDYLLGAKELNLVDLNSECISFCKEKYKDNQNIIYNINDGKNLSFIESNSIDFIWSFDSFVHMERDVIDSYLHEFSRILNKWWAAIIHHAWRINFWLWLEKTLKGLWKQGHKLYNFLTMHYRTKFWNTDEHCGCRSQVSSHFVKTTAIKYGLHIEGQTDSWKYNSKKPNVQLFNDMITLIIK